MYTTIEVKLRLEKILLQNCQRDVVDLQQLLVDVNGDFSYEDGVYRFYHQSWKVYYLQNETSKLVAALKKLSPEERPFCEFFQKVIQVGIGRSFAPEANERWIEETLPITTAFFHARYFVEMATKYSQLPEPPKILPSGWAALLSLYDLR